MRRVVPTLAALAALAGPTVAGAEEAPSLAARLDVCEIGIVPGSRVAEFTGAMPAIPGSSVLAMRFAFEQRRGSVFKPVPLPAFKGYEQSEPGAAGFVFAKRVERLAAGASYRVSVRFRWTAADGRVLRRATRTSRICRQPDLRPDLAVVGLTTEAVAGGRARYVARLRNDGPGALADLVGLRLTVDGVAQAVQLAPGPGAGAASTVMLEGPACGPGGTARLDVDPRDAVEEVDESDNAVLLRCS